MAQVQLTAQARSDTGKGAAHRLRFAGGIPGIVYGPDHEPVMISVETRSFQKMMREMQGGAVLVNLTVDGASDGAMKVLIKEVQRDPVTSQPLHMDLIRVSLDKPVHLVVPIQLTGMPVGVKLEGGFMDHVLREVEVACLPMDIPDVIDIDVTGLNVGDSLHVSDIPTEKFEILTPADRVIAAVHGKSVANVAEEAAEAAAAEAAEAAATEAGEADKKDSE